MSPRLRSGLVLAAKLAVAGGIIAFLAASGKLTGKDVKEAFGRLVANWQVLPGCLLLLMVMVLVGAARWRMLLGSQGFELPYWRVLHLGLIGMFFNCVGVGYTGGDVVKAYYVAADQPRGRRAEAVATVVFDRVAGMFALLLLGALAMLSRPATVWADPELRFAALALLAILVGGAAAFLLSLSAGVRAFLERPGRLEKLPGGGLLLRAHRAAAIYRSRPGALLGAIGISFAGHGVTFGLFWLLGRALGIPPISPSDLIFCIAVGIAVSSVGLPLGIGLGQGAFAFLFSKVWPDGGASLGAQMITLYQAVMLSFYLLVGLPAFLAARRRVAEIRAQARADAERGEARP